MFVDKVQIHRCDEMALPTQEPDFDLARALNSEVPNPA